MKEFNKENINKFTSESIDAINAANIIKVQTLIEDAASNGKFEYLFKRSMPDYIITYLKNAGFSVERKHDNDNRWHYVINWE